MGHRGPKQNPNAPKSSRYVARPGDQRHKYNQGNSDLLGGRVHLP